MESTKSLQSRSGNESLSISATPGAQYATVHVQRTDEFDGDEDYWVTVGEFKVADIIEALIPPVSAAHHVASAPPKTIKRRHPWRRK